MNTNHGSSELSHQQPLPHSLIMNHCLIGNHIPYYQPELHYLISNQYLQYFCYLSGKYVRDANDDSEDLERRPEVDPDPGFDYSIRGKTALSVGFAPCEARLLVHGVFNGGSV